MRELTARPAFLRDPTMDSRVRVGQQTFDTQQQTELDSGVQSGGRMFQRLALALVVLFACVLSSFARPAPRQAPPSFPSPIIVPFDVWVGFPHESKIMFYSGWANGLFTNTKDPGALALRGCVEKLTFDQIVAMIDKWHADHREDWHKPMSTEMIDALTAAGSPCAGISVGS
jgi:hypothetical protein